MNEQWRTCELGTLFQLRSEKNKQIKATEYLESGELPVIDQSERFIAGYIDDSARGYSGQLPIIVFGDHTRVTKFIDFPFGAGADGTQLLAPTPQMDPRFLYYVVSRASLLIGNYGYDRHLKHLRRFNTCVPINVHEQGRIAEVLKELDDVIEKTESLIAKYQQIKAGLTHDLFTRGVTADGKLRPPREQAPELYQETPIGWIPKEWSVGLVTDCGSVQLGRQRSPNQLSGQWTTPYLRVANVFDGFIDYSDVLEMDFTPAERDTFSVRRGDILLNEGQSLELVGRCALYDGPDNFYCFQNTIVRFRPYQAHIPTFYRYLFKWWLDCGRFMAIAKQTTSVAHLGADRFAKMKCPLLEKDEQERIAARLASAQLLASREEQRAKKLKQQKSGLMHDLLTGKVKATMGVVVKESARV